jgi:hypothetical protein
LIRITFPFGFALASVRCADTTLSTAMTTETDNTPAMMHHACIHQAHLWPVLSAFGDW